MEEQLLPLFQRIQSPEEDSPETAWCFGDTKGSKLLTTALCSPLWNMPGQCSFTTSWGSKLWWSLCTPNNKPSAFIAPWFLTAGFGDKQPMHHYLPDHCLCCNSDKSWQLVSLEPSNTLQCNRIGLLNYCRHHLTPAYLLQSQEN